MQEGQCLWKVIRGAQRVHTAQIAFELDRLTLSSCTSLSIPRGPKVVLTVSTTAMHAFMLLISCGVPWLVSVPSLSRMI